MKIKKHFISKFRYLIFLAFFALIIVYSLNQWFKRNSYEESKYFIHYFPFASKSSPLKTANTHLNKLKLREIDILGNRTSAIQLPLNHHLDYYVKIPEDAKLKISFKHYGPQRTDDLVEFNITIQEESGIAEQLFSYKFPKDFIKNKWRTEQVSLKGYSNKIVKLTFSVMRYGAVTGHREGLYLNPILLLNKHIVQSQRDMASTKKLIASSEYIKKTNVIIIILDAARPDHFGCYGYHRRTTPYIDHLAKESVLFKNAFSVAPYTVSSTTSLFTSLYPNTHQVTRWQETIPDRLITLTDILRQNGYATYGSGFVMSWGGKGFNQDFELNITSKQKLQDNLYTFLKEKFVDKKTVQPAFVYIHLRPPHADYDPPMEFDKWSDTEKRVKFAELIKVPALLDLDKGLRGMTQERLEFIIDKYDGNLLWADWLVNFILKGFKKFGLYDNSLIIVASDHGEAFWEHGRLMHNSTVYNEMIKIPLIIKFPSYIKPLKKVIETNVENIDLMPTVLELLQINYSHLNVQGRSLLPVVFGDGKEVKQHFFSRGFWPELFSIHDSHYKYIQAFDDRELYDLLSDPQEKDNLASTKPILLGYYQSLANFYRRQLIKAQKLKPAKAKLNEETKTKLRSLGYLQ